MRSRVSRELAKIEVELRQVKEALEEAAHEGRKSGDVAADGQDVDQPAPQRLCSYWSEM